eukprot:5935613-Pleurochrysis_carterae.AAC.2
MRARSLVDGGTPAAAQTRQSRSDQSRTRSAQSHRLHSGMTAPHLLCAPSLKPRCAATSLHSRVHVSTFTAGSLTRFTHSRLQLALMPMRARATQNLRNSKPLDPAGTSSRRVQSGL